MNPQGNGRHRAVSDGNGRGPMLPEPRRERWQPLRAGLVDLFFYDAEEFWFRDGHLLLRGNNGTGKSKVLALTLPYLLDGDHRSQRVEPDGDLNKRMEWNLLLGGRYSDRLGYTWIEFGRRAADGSTQIVTLGCGLKAVASRGIASKWFFVTDQRMGRGLTLVDAGGLVLSRDRLREALGERGELFDRVEAYRRAIDERLFRLGPERYDALVTLLIQLRQPQLSKRPNEQALSDALTRALPPLEDAVVNDVADAFHALEDERSELAALVEARAAVDGFRSRYQRYAAIATRRHAAVVRQAQSAYESTNRRLTDAVTELDAAEQRQRQISDRRANANRELHRARAEERTLRESPEMRDAQRLQDAAVATERAATAAERAQGELDDALDDVQERQDELDRCADAAERAGEHLVRAVARAADAAAEAGVGSDHDALVSGIGTDGDPHAAPPVREAGALADRRDEAVRHVRALIGRAADAERDRAEARRALDGAARQRDAVNDDLIAAGVEARRAGDDLLAAFERYAAETRELHIGDLDAVSADLADWVTSLAGDNPAAVAVHTAARQAERALAAEDTRLAALGDQVEAQVAEVTAERAELEAGLHTAPPVPYTRAEGVRDRLAGAPLWRLVDFAEHVRPAERAKLEAALEAAGLLDAWVTPDGSLVAADTHDVVVTADTPAASPLTAVLRPAIDTGHETVPTEAVTAVLAGIGLGAATADTWVDRDGRFRVGVLEGAWGKDQPEYVGHAAREQARRRRLAALDELDARLRERATDLTRQRVQVAARRSELDADVRRLPSDDGVRAAAGAVTALTRQLAQADEQVAVLDDRLARTQAVLDRAVEARDAAAGDLRLPVEPVALDAVATAVTRYRLGLESLWPAVREARTAQAALRRAQADQARAVALVTRRAREADERRREADEAAQVHATLQQTVGAAASEVTARLRAATTRVSDLEALAERLNDEWAVALERTGEARGRERELRAQVDEHAAGRVEATGALRRFAETGLMAAALGDDPSVSLPDTAVAWAPDPSVRLARRLDQALEHVDAGDDAWDRAANTLMHHLSDLQRVLAVHGHHAAGDQRENVWVVTIQFRSSTVTPDQLTRHLSADISHRERLLDAKERQVLEEHLVAEAASQLTALISDAEHRVARMNRELEARPTSTGMVLRLRWAPAPDAPAGLAEARRRLLRQAVDAWSPGDRQAIGDFLKAQIDAVRAADEAGTWREHLSTALDYRRWHRFVIERYTDGRWRQATGPASGGERVLTVTVPLFAAASAHYESAHEHAPRLVLLDEAFAGVDDDSRAKCMGLLDSFDLDYVMTSEREWGCYSTVPGLAICQLVRRDGIDAVHVSRWEWDGHTPTAVDYPSRSAMAAAEVRTPADDEASATLFGELG